LQQIIYGLIFGALAARLSKALKEKNYLSALNHSPVEKSITKSIWLRLWRGSSRCGTCSLPEQYERLILLWFQSLSASYYGIAWRAT
jgi:hypothetical protein